VLAKKTCQIAKRQIQSSDISANYERVEVVQKTGLQHVEVIRTSEN
jgi:hypothetical protein